MLCQIYMAFLIQINTNIFRKIAIFVSSYSKYGTSKVDALKAPTLSLIKW